MYGKAVTAPCGHPGETIIGTYVRCLRGCDANAVKAETKPRTNFGNVNTKILADYYEARNKLLDEEIAKQQRIVAKPRLLMKNGPAPQVVLPNAPKEAPCRKCKQLIPFNRMSRQFPGRAIYDCTHGCRETLPIPARTSVVGPFGGPP